MHKCVFDGVWWNPETPNVQVSGQLEFDADDGLRLRLFGVLTSADLFSVQTTHLPIVHGEVSSTDGVEGGLVTLFACFRGRTEISRVSRQELRPGLAVFGAHLATQQDLVVSSAEVSYSQLPNWLDAAGFTLTLHSEKLTAGEPIAYDVSYRPVSLPTVTVPNAEIRFILRSIPPLFATRTYPLQEWVGLRIVLNVPITFAQFRREILWYLQNFFTLAAAHRNALTSVRIDLPNSSGLEVLYQHSVEHEAGAHPLEMTFTYSTVADRLSEMLGKWFSLSSTLGPALNSMFSVIYGQVSSTDTRFLNAIQAAESYDRRMSPEANQASHRLRVNRIWLNAPAEYRDWVYGKLATAYEPFLSERLKRIFGRLGSDFLNPMFESRSELKNVLWHMGVWRNSLTHITSDVTAIASNLKWLHVATNQLLVALKANLLLDLGFTVEELPQRFKHDQTYHFFSRHSPDDEKL